MNVLSKLYTKHVIKSGAVFYLFLLAGVAVFLIMTLSLKVDIVVRYKASFDNNKIVVNEILEDINSIYIYRSLNEKVYYFPVRETEHFEQYTVIYVDNENESIKKQPVRRSKYRNGG